MFFHLVKRSNSLPIVLTIQPKLKCGQVISGNNYIFNSYLVFFIFLFCILLHISIFYFFSINLIDSFKE